MDDTIKCRKCGHTIDFDAEFGVWAERVSPRGVEPQLWECRPACGAKVSLKERLLQMFNFDGSDDRGGDSAAL